MNENPILIPNMVSSAIQMLLLLGVSDKPVSGKTLAEIAGISASYAEQIIQRMRRARMLKAKRGATGGYTLVLPLKAITVAELLRIMCKTERRNRQLKQIHERLIKGAEKLTLADLLQ